MCSRPTLKTLGEEVLNIKEQAGNRCVTSRGRRERREIKLTMEEKVGT